MQQPTEAVLLRIFVGEDDRYGDRPLCEAIVAVAGDLDLARRMGEAGRRRALSRFLQSACTERTELLYEGALATTM